MDERIKVGARGQVVIPKKIRKRFDIEHGVVLEVKETGEGIILKPYNPIRKLRGLGRGLFGDPVNYQKKLRKEWEQ